MEARVDGTNFAGWRSNGGLRWWAVCCVVCALAGIAADLIHLVVFDPSVVVLPSDRGGRWITSSHDVQLGLHQDALTLRTFRTNVEIPAGFSGATLWVRALRGVNVRFDKQSLFATDALPDQWKERYAVRLPATLASGAHQLSFSVLNTYGPALLLAYCPALHLASGPGWECESPDGRIVTAMAADAIFAGNSAVYPTNAQYVWRERYVLGILALLGAGMAWLLRGGTDQKAKRFGHVVRWAVLLFWVAMGIDNLAKLPAHVGYDYDGHVQYVQFILAHHRLPVAGEGWEAFNAPLHYLILAILEMLFSPWMSPARVLVMLRLEPLICGAAMAELSYRTVRYALPDRPAAWTVATLVGGLLPVNLYMAFGLSGDPLSACLACVAILIAIGLLSRERQGSISRRSGSGAAIACGAVLGLAILAKVTAVIWLPILLAAVMWAMRRTGAGRAGVQMIVASFVVCGWYFIRNILATHQLFTLNYDPPVFHWWQEPGYRTLGQLFTFGHVFGRFPFSGIIDLPDSLYSTLWADGLLSGGTTLWNLPLMGCGVWLSVVPCALIVAGIAMGCWKMLRWFGGAEHRTAPVGIWIVVLGLACLLWAIVRTYLQVPVYGWGKASYLASGTTCLAVAAAVGYDWVSQRSRLFRAFFVIGLFMWAIVICLAFTNGGVLRD